MAGIHATARRGCRRGVSLLSYRPFKMSSDSVFSFLFGSPPAWCDRDALTELGLERYCCRRMVLTHVDLIEKLLKYNRKSTSSGKGGRLLIHPSTSQRTLKGQATSEERGHGHRSYIGPSIRFLFIVCIRELSSNNCIQEKT